MTVHGDFVQSTTRTGSGMPGPFGRFSLSTNRRGEACLALRER